MEFFFSSVLSSSTWKRIFFYKHVSSGQAQNCCIFYWAPLPSPRGESAGMAAPRPTWAFLAAAEQGLGLMLFAPAQALCSISTPPALRTQHSCPHPTSPSASILITPTERANADQPFKWQAKESWQTGLHQITCYAPSCILKQSLIEGTQFESQNGMNTETLSEHNCETIQVQGKCNSPWTLC